MSNTSPADHKFDGANPAVAILLTAEEQARKEAERREDARRDADEAFKQRQINATEAANRLSSRSLLVAIVSGAIAVIACVGTWYQGYMTRATLAEISKQTTAAEESADAADRSSLVAQRAERESERAGAIQEKLAADSLQVTIQDFRQDERPYVVVELNSPVRFQAGSRIFANFTQVNYGRTPAMKAEGITNILFGADALGKADEFFAQLDRRGYGSKTLPTEASSTITPGPPISGKPDFSTAVSTRVTSESDLKDISSASFHVAIVGRITYLDAFNHRYYTDFCYTFFVNGAIPSCPKHNTMK